CEVRAQFELGKYLKQLDPSYNHPEYRVDFLIKISMGGPPSNWPPPKRPRLCSPALSLRGASDALSRTPRAMNERSAVRFWRAGPSCMDSRCYSRMGSLARMKNLVPWLTGWFRDSSPA